MGYGNYFKKLLEPLELYSLAGMSGIELEVIGSEFDLCAERLAKGEKESLIITAEDEGLEMYERVLPYVPSYISAQDRRHAILALVGIDGASFTAKALNDAIVGCGIKAFVRETGQAQTVEVSFPGCRGIPDNIVQLKAKIEEILPCHLAVNYYYLYTTWGEVQGYFASWNLLENEIECWKEFEIYCREG